MNRPAGELDGFSAPECAPSAPPGLWRPVSGSIEAALRLGAATQLPDLHETIP